MRILFIGNSHTYFNDMPYQFAELMRAAGNPTEVTMLSRGGQSLQGHLKNEQTRFNIRYGGYDFVVMQEVTSDFPEKEEYAAWVAQMKALCDEAHVPCGLYMNFESPKDTPKLDYLRTGVLHACEQLHLPCARVGEAFAKANATLPNVDLYFTDRHHASAVGSYLIALTIAHDLFGIDVRGLPAAVTWREETIVSVPVETAAALQRLVMEL